MGADRQNSPGAFPQVASYVVAVVIVLMAAVTRRLLDPLLGDSVPYITFFLAVVVAGGYGGLGPALLATVLGLVLARFLFISPRHSLRMPETADVAGLIVFAIMALAISGFSEVMHASRRRSKKAEDDSREHAERLRTTLASIGDAVITTDAAGIVVNLNPVAEALTKWKNEEAIGQPLESVFRIVNEISRDIVASPAIRVLAEGVIVGLANHTILIAKDGTECPIDDSAAPIRSNDGQIVGCVLVFRDVSERRRHEQENASRLIEARKLAAIVESSDDAIVSKTLDGVIQSWNAAAERIFGYSAGEAIGQHISLIIPPERASEEDKIVTELKAGNRIDHFETVRRRRDGQKVYVSLSISPIKDASEHVVGAAKIARDVSSKRHLEEERQRLVTLVENSTDFIGICDLAGKPIFVNRAGLKMIGLSDLEDARRRTVSDFFFPEDQPMIENEFLPMVRERGHGEVEVRFRHFKTGEALWMAYKVVALPEIDDTVFGFATVSQNITQRRQLEHNLRKLAVDLSEAGRRKDEFLATLAHELRNPLAPIRNAVQLIRLSSDPSTVADARAVMERQLDQMVRLVDDLLDVSRITRGKIELRRHNIRVEEMLNSAVDTSRPLIEQMGHQLSVTMPDKTLIVNADLTRLAQVVANLLNNSAKYTDRGGQIWLTATEDGDDLVVSVKDTGIGISSDHLSHIFEMFSQVDGALDRSQGGLGIGLTLVKRLVEMHGGTVEARSQGKNQGAEFIVRLPAIVRETKSESVATNGDADSPSTSLRILIVDDNRDAARSLMALLKIKGYETLTAFDGQQAIEQAGEFRPDIVLLDIGLPKMNGYEVCQQIRKQAWAQQTVLIALTGWGQDEDRRRSQDAGFDYHLTKPVMFQDLMRILSESGDSKERV